MLILTRKINEEIMINANLLSGEPGLPGDLKGITIKILSVSDSQVKIGIEAPPYVQIFRGEIFEKIVNNTKDASQQSKIKLNRIPALKLNKINNGVNSD